MDEAFAKKLAKNLGRPFQYGEGHRARNTEEKQKP
jgi:hypothetical protein